MPFTRLMLPFLGSLMSIKSLMICNKFGCENFCKVRLISGVYRSEVPAKVTDANVLMGMSMSTLSEALADIYGRPHLGANTLVVLLVGGICENTRM